MNITEQLSLLDLNPNEIVVYLHLLKHKVSTPPIVSRETNITRTNCYYIFDTLMQKRLIDEVPDGKRKSYQVRPPEALVHYIDSKKRVAENVVPTLQEYFNDPLQTAHIEVGFGIDYLTKILASTVNTKIVYVAGDLSTTLSADAHDNYLKILRENNTVLRTIVDIDHVRELHNMQRVLRTYFGKRVIPHTMTLANQCLVHWDDGFLIADPADLKTQVIRDRGLTEVIRKFLDVMWLRL